MTTAPGLTLHRPGDSVLHRLRPEVKIVCSFLAILAVVATPREYFAVFGLVFAVLPIVWAVAGVPVGWFAKRALIEVPFVVLAVALPFISGAPFVEVLGVQVSREGTLAAWNIVAKGTLGVLISLTLAATTHPTDLIAGLRGLRVPRLLTTIAGLMLRFVHVIVEEAARMRIARISRGDDPRFLWQAGALARGIGTLFLRSYERGERVHLAMLSRGWTSRDGPAELAFGKDTAVEIAASTARPPALEVRALRYAYPDGYRALNGVNLRVEQGERVAVLGPNGSGKTTLVRHLNGVLTGEHGDVAIGGLSLDKRTVREIRRRVGLVFQEPDDQLFMSTVAEDVAFGPANFGLTEPDLSARVHAALAAVGMADQAARSPLHLSGGQRRRVALATVLACEPEVLVLDEPSSNLEPVARRELAELLLSLGHTMLMVTHDLPYALQLCPRAVLIDDGVIVADAPTRELLSDRELLARHRLELPWGFALD